MVIKSTVVYEPREDSFLLQKQVELFAAGSVLEVGIGSGILLFTAAKMPSVTKAAGVDINPKAITYCKKILKNDNTIPSEKIELIISNKFEKIDEQFDTIICNPPYLPNDKRITDPALDGGKHGYEWTKNFLDNVNPHLSKMGIVLLLFSSLTKKEKVEEFIADNCFTFSELSTETMEDGEILYVYKIEKSLLLRDLEHVGVSDVKKFDRGRRGLIYTGMFKNEKIAIKFQRPDSNAKETVNNESIVLDYFRNEGFSFIPDVLFTGPHFFAYKFIEGSKIHDFLKKAPKKKIITVLHTILDHMFTLDAIKYNKLEMNHPHKHILIDEKTLDVKLIDFERCKKVDSPKNVTQFCTFLTSSEVTEIFTSKKIKIDAEQLRKKATAYKRTYSKKAFDKIKEEIK